MTGQEKTTKVLKYAIQMEIDGKALYLKVSRESGNERGKRLMESLGEVNRLLLAKLREP
jgi:rubrerythrin